MGVTGGVWLYRGRRLKQLEWGLWRDLDRPGYYFLCYRPAGRKGPVIRRWAYADGARLTRLALQDHVRRVRAEIEGRKAGVDLPVDSASAVEEYLAEQARLGRHTRHIAGCRKALEDYLTASGVSFVAQADVYSIERFLGGLGLSGRSQNKTRALLHAWFAWCIRRGWLTVNPAASVGRVKETQEMKVFPSPEEFTAFCRASSVEDARLWVLFALTGLRRGSILSLSATCFHPDGILVPHTKRGREWFMSYDAGCPLWGPELSDLGRAIWEAGTPTVSSLRTAIDRSSEAAEVHYTLHGFRHAFCSWLAMSGESLLDIRDWAHHSTASTTERWYAHLSPRGRSNGLANRQRVFTMRSQSLALCLPTARSQRLSAG